VKSLKARLEVARKHAENNKSKNNDIQQKSFNSNYNQNNHNHKHKGRHQNHNHQRREGYINEIDYEQAKMLKRNFHGDEYDNFGNGNESIVSLIFIFNKCFIILI
jgi:hypothetical protein